MRTSRTGAPTATHRVTLDIDLHRLPRILRGVYLDLTASSALCLTRPLLLVLSVSPSRSPLTPTGPIFSSSASTPLWSAPQGSTFCTNSSPIVSPSRPHSFPLSLSILLFSYSDITPSSYPLFIFSLHLLCASSLFLCIHCHFLSYSPSTTFSILFHSIFILFISSPFSYFILTLHIPTFTIFPSLYLSTLSSCSSFL